MGSLRARCAAVLFVTAVIVMAASGVARCEGSKVAVFPLKNLSKTEYAGMSAGLSAMITTDLNKSDNLEVIEPQVVMGALSRARLTNGAPVLEDVFRAAGQLGADYAVTGTFVVFGGKFRIDISVYDVKTRALKFADKEQAGEKEFFDKVDDLSDRIIIKLAGSLPKAKAALSVDSTPQGASITLDGEDAGETPAAMDSIAPGQHVVELELYGYKPYTETVTVAAGEKAEVNAVLVPMNGGIRVWWKEQPTSDVQIGGDVVSASSFTSSYPNPPTKYCRNMPAGTYKVSVRMPYKDETSWDSARTWKTYTADVEIRPGEVTDVYIYNKLFGPSVDISSCSSCAASWDFDTKVIWYEQVNY